MTKFKIGQGFKGGYPPEVAAWCMENNAYIKQQEHAGKSGERNYIILANEPRVKTKAEEMAELEAYLASTDWYVTRKAETGKDIPAEVLDARAVARARIGALRSEIATESKK